MTHPPEHALATYGTLAPGRRNHHQLDGLEGTWLSGTVRGHLHPEGWGAALGFPGIVLDDDGAEVSVQVLVSRDLVRHWPRLDAFEGEGYRRTTVVVATATGAVQAQIYELAAAPDQ